MNKEVDGTFFAFGVINI